MKPKHIPSHIKGLLHSVKTYESLAIDAAVTGNRGLALLALAHHPLVPSVSIAKVLFGEMLEAHRAYLPQFFDRV
ncbi:putative 6-phospho-beta-glucosidase [compost metagenome]